MSATEILVRGHFLLHMGKGKNSPPMEHAAYQKILYVNGGVPRLDETVNAGNGIKIVVKLVEWPAYENADGVLDPPVVKGPSFYFSDENITAATLEAYGWEKTAY